jgi:hypothetical protein
VITKPSRKKIARLFTTSLMSNSKWRKTFSMIGPRNANLRLEQAAVKFIDVDTERAVTAFNGDWLLRQTPWAYIDLWEFGPVALNSIEWFEFLSEAVVERAAPSGTGRLPPIRRAQDIDAAEAVINKLGKYPLERTERGLRIIGHIRR